MFADAVIIIGVSKPFLFGFIAGRPEVNSAPLGFLLVFRGKREGGHNNNKLLTWFTVGFGGLLTKVEVRKELSADGGIIGGQICEEFGCCNQLRVLWL